MRPRAQNIVYQSVGDNENRGRVILGYQQQQLAD